MTKLVDSRKFSFFILDAEIWDAGLDAYEFAVYSRLAYRAGKNASSWESATHIAEATKISVRKVKEVLKALEGRGLISKTSRTRPDGSQTTNKIELTDKSEWKRPEIEQNEHVISCVTHPQRVQDMHGGGVHHVHAPTEPDPANKIQNEELRNISTGKSENRRPKPAGTVSKGADSGDTDPELLKVAADWLEYAQTAQPWQTRYKAEAFISALKRIQAKAGCETAALARLLAFIRRDKFWGPNAISPVALLRRSKNADCEKWELVMRSMIRDKTSRTDAILERLNYDELPF